MYLCIYIYIYRFGGYSSLRVSLPVFNPVSLSRFRRRSLPLLPRLGRGPTKRRKEEGASSRLPEQPLKTKPTRNQSSWQLQGSGVRTRRRRRQQDQGRRPRDKKLRASESPARSLPQAQPAARPAYFHVLLPQPRPAKRNRVGPNQTNHIGKDLRQQRTQYDEETRTIISFDVTTKMAWHACTEEGTTNDSPLLPNPGSIISASQM